MEDGHDEPVEPVKIFGAEACRNAHCPGRSADGRHPQTPDACIHKNVCPIKKGETNGR